MPPAVHAQVPRTGLQHGVQRLAAGDEQRSVRCHLNWEKISAEQRKEAVIRALRSGRVNRLSQLPKVSALA